jgi:hypothetical protein
MKKHSCVDWEGKGGCTTNGLIKNHFKYAGLPQHKAQISAYSHEITDRPEWRGHPWGKLVAVIERQQLL